MPLWDHFGIRGEFVLSLLSHNIKPVEFSEAAFFIVINFFCFSHGMHSILENPLFGAHSTWTLESTSYFFVGITMSLILFDN